MNISGKQNFTEDHQAAIELLALIIQHQDVGALQTGNGNMGAEWCASFITELAARLKVMKSGVDRS